MLNNSSNNNNETIDLTRVVSEPSILVTLETIELSSDSSPEKSYSPCSNPLPLDSFSETPKTSKPSKRKIVRVDSETLKNLESRIFRLETQSSIKEVNSDGENDISEDDDKENIFYETPEKIHKNSNFIQKPIRVKLEIPTTPTANKNQVLVSIIQEHKPIIPKQPSLENFMNRDFAYKQLEILKYIAKNGLTNYKFNEFQPSDYKLSEKVSAVAFVLKKFYSNKRALKPKFTRYSKKNTKRIDLRLKYMFRLYAEAEEFEDLYEKFWKSQEKARKKLIRGRLEDNKDTDEYREWEKAGKAVASEDIIIRTKEDLNKLSVGPEIRYFASRVMDQLKPDRKYENEKLEVVEEDAAYGGTIAVRSECGKLEKSKR